MTANCHKSIPVRQILSELSEVRNVVYLTGSHYHGIHQLLPSRSLSHHLGSPPHLLRLPHQIPVLQSCGISIYKLGLRRPQERQN